MVVCVSVCMCGDGPTNRLQKKTKKNHFRNIYALIHRNKTKERERKKTKKESMRVHGGARTL